MIIKENTDNLFYINSNGFLIPIKEFVDRVSKRNGFSSYEDALQKGYCISLSEEDICYFVS